MEQNYALSEASQKGSINMNKNKEPDKKQEVSKLTINGELLLTVKIHIKEG